MRTTCRKKISYRIVQLLSAVLLAVLCSCGSRNPAESTAEQKSSQAISEGLHEESHPEDEPFELWKNSLQSRYAGKYVVLQTEEGNEENHPIKYVALVSDMQDNNSSTLLIQDSEGLGTVTLAGGCHAQAISSEPFWLEKNQIHIALYLPEEQKVHDFVLTVEQIEKEGILSPVYRNDESVRP